jgi:hypothetical protein
MMILAYFPQKAISLLLIFSLAFAPLLTSCGSGTDSNNIQMPAADNELIVHDPSESDSGTAYLDPVTDGTVYNGAEIVIAPGVVLSESLLLIPDDPTSGRPVFWGGIVLKFSNTNDVTANLKFLVSSAGILAQDISDLKFKVVNSDSEIDSIDILFDSEGFDGIEGLIDAGLAEVIYKNDDPSALQRAIPGSVTFWVLVTLAVSAFATQHVALVTDKSSILDVPPVCLPSQIINKDLDRKKKWINNWLNQYCENFKKSAKENNIPPSLLAAVILNELSDFDAFDQTQMVVRERDIGSYGWGQLQITRVRNHNLIDIGTGDKIRNADVDISEAELQNDGKLGKHYIPREILIGNKIWERLVNPKTGIEIAAREISYILDQFKKGSSALNGSWAKALLKNPSEGIDKNDIYSNLKTGIETSDPLEQQKNLEESLAILIIGPYNTPNIIYETDPSKVQLDKSTPWQEPPLEGKDYYNARQHAVNVKSTLIAKLMNDMPCFKLWLNYPFPERCEMTGTAGRYERIDTNDNPNDNTYIECSYYSNDYGEYGGQLHTEIPYLDGEEHGYAKFYWDGKLEGYYLFVNGVIQ